MSEFVCTQQLLLIKFDVNEQWVNLQHVQDRISRVASVSYKFKPCIQVPLSYYSKDKWCILIGVMEPFPNSVVRFTTFDASFSETNKS